MVRVCQMRSGSPLSKNSPLEQKYPELVGIIMEQLLVQMSVR